MNPWIEGVWSDFHTILIGYIRDALCDELPDDLVARAEEHISLSSTSGESLRRKVDVAVIEGDPWRHGERPAWTPESDPDLANRLAKPILIEVDEVTHRWVEIRSASDQLITVIEVTSPSNKTLHGRADFERKVRDLLEAGVNVMEIDLIRIGEAAQNHRPGKWPNEPCQVIVNRAQRPGQTEVYPCPLRESLPAVRVPLRPHEPDAGLDLQKLVDQAYTRGRYWMLPYDKDPIPPLSDSDLKWARERLAEPAD
jgi:hypothetical protein